MYFDHCVYVVLPLMPLVCMAASKSQSVQNYCRQESVSRGVVTITNKLHSGRLFHLFVEGICFAVTS